MLNNDENVKNVLLESSLLKTLSNREYYEKYYDLIDKKRVLPTTSLLLKDFEKYFSLYPDDIEIKFDRFITHFNTNWHARDLDEIEISYYLEHVFPKLITNYNNEIIDHKCVNGFIREQFRKQLIEAVNSELSLDKLRTLLDDYENKGLEAHKNKKDLDVFTIENVDFDILDKSVGIPFFMKGLQDGLGSLVKGQFIVVSADYGTGKSAFVLSQAAHTIKHLHKNDNKNPILYFNSEGTEADVFGRMLSNLYYKIFTDGFEEIVEKREEIKKRFLEKFSSDQFLVFQILSNNIEYIRSKIELYKPSLVIIDITDVLASQEDVQSLKKVYDTLRLFAGKYCPIIGTTQSGDTSYRDNSTGEIKTRKWLGDKALYGSKSGKGGAADTIITIGKDDINPKIRYVSTPKKKRGTSVNITCELIDKFSMYKELEF